MVDLFCGALLDLLNVFLNLPDYISLQLFFLYDNEQVLNLYRSFSVIACVGWLSGPAYCLFPVF